MRLLNYLCNPRQSQAGQNTRLLDYVSGTGPATGGQDGRAGTRPPGNAFDAQEAQQDYNAQDWAFDHMGGGFGGFGGLGGREFDATQDDPWTVDLWRDE